MATKAEITVLDRRIYQRTQDPRPSLQCEAYSGAAGPFVAEITDMSQGGIGLEMDSATALEPGMVLAGCGLYRLDREPVIADLEVRHTETARLPDGRQVLRAGCRFLTLSPAAMALIAEYVDTKPPRT
jgi:PilZ domain